MKELFGLAIGLIVGWVGRVIFSDSETRRLRLENGGLYARITNLRESLSVRDKLYRKTKISLLDLTRRYNKVYNNKYN